MDSSYDHDDFRINLAKGMAESDPRHTFGPWEDAGTGTIIRTKTSSNQRGGMSGGTLVAQFWTKPSPADMRLMVAAPELLAALRGLVNEHIKRGGAFDEPCGSSEQTPEMNAAIAALEKAGA